VFALANFRKVGTFRSYPLPAGLATALLATRDATAALPASLIASTGKLANLVTAGGLAAGSGSAAAAYAEGVLKAGSFVGLGKSAAIITLVFKRDPPVSASVGRDVSDGGASREERP
jgi:hypothetical protein